MPVSPRPPECPSAENLLAFDRGALGEPALAAVAEHVGACASCQSRLADAARASGRDPLLRDLRCLGLSGDTAPEDSSLTAVRPTEPPGDPQATGGYLPSDDTPPDPLRTQVTPAQPPADSPTRTVAAGAAPAEAATAPEEFGRYRLLGKLGEGGMGVVYKALDPRLKRTVALKMIRAGRASDEERRRFLAEAEAVARLEHPNIVRIYEVGEVGGQPFAALEFVPGGSLDERIKDTLPDARAAARLMVPVCRAVHAAHELKVVHRDLKPANVLLGGDGKGPLDVCAPKVTDFGLAKFLDAADAGGTRANAVMGTPSYMAPEQAEGRADVGPAADIHALGATLYDLLSGRPPFKGTTVRETLKMVIEQDPVPPRQLQAGVPRDLETICLKCLQKDPRKRYASAAELADDLQRFLDGEPIAARPVGRAEKLWRWCRRKPALATLSGFSITAAMVLLLGAFWFTYAVADEQRKKEVAEQAAAREHAEREAARADKEAAEARRQSAENLQKMNRYFALVMQARERVVTRGTGWTWRAADDLREAAGIDTPARNPPELRSVLASCLAGTEVRESRVIAPGFHSRALCYHPNGKWLILAEGRVGVGLLSPLGVLIVDAQTGETVKKLSFPSGLVGGLTDPRPDMANAVAITSDGRWLVVGTRSGSVHRWDLKEKNPEVKSWQPEPAALGKTNECIGLAFAPDGAALYVATDLKGDGTITRWEVAAWKRTARHKTEKAAGGLVVSPRGDAVYCLSAPHLAVRELDPVTLEMRLEFAHTIAATRALSPDGRIMAASNARYLMMWDIRTHGSVYSIRQPYREVATEDTVEHLCFSPDGRLLVGTNEHSRHLYLWDVATGQRVADVRVEEGYACPAFDPSSRFLAVSGNKGAQILEIVGQREHRTVAPQLYPVRPAGLSPDGKLLALTVSSDGHGGGKAIPMLWDLESERRVEPLWKGDWFGLGGKAGSVSFTRGDGLLAIVSEGELKVFDRRKGNEVRFALARDAMRAAVFDADERLWAIADKHVLVARAPFNEKNLLQWTNPIVKITGLGSMTSLGVGKASVAVGGLDGSLRVFSTAIPERATELQLHKLIPVENRIALSAVAVAPDDSFAVVGSDSGKGRLVALPEGEILAEWDAHADAVSAAVFLNAGVFATGGNDRAVRFWSWDGKRVSELWTIRTSAPVASLGASAKGRVLAVACLDERGFHVWDLAALNRRFAEYGLNVEGPRSW